MINLKSNPDRSLRLLGADRGQSQNIPLHRIFADYCNDQNDCHKAVATNGAGHTSDIFRWKLSLQHFIQIEWLK